MKIAKKATFIYALVDPRDCQIKYIGKTVMDPAERMNCHLYQKSKTYKWFWIKKLCSLGLKPEMVILEIVPIGNDWEKRERWWIDFGNYIGWPLTNLTPGGDGWETGRKHSIESRQKMSKVQRGRIISEAARAKLSAINSGVGNPNYGKPRSKETRARISQARSGNPLSSEHRKQLSLAAQNRPPITEKTRAKLRTVARRGADNHNTKLNEEQVLNIRQEYADGNITQDELAIKFHVCQRTISMIVRRITWQQI